MEKAGWVAEHVCADPFSAVALLRREEVPHRQFVFTIPKGLRIYFRFERRLLGESCRAAALSPGAQGRRRLFRSSAATTSPIFNLPSSSGLGGVQSFEKGNSYELINGSL